MTRVTALLCGWALLSGCGPARSTSHILDADVQVQAARTAGAEQYAPYEWTSANLYLRKAREEVGYSNFKSAVTFAEKASQYANEARARSLSAPRAEDPASAMPEGPQ